MGATAAAANSAGFKSRLMSGSLPAQDHISYEGAFNELTFKIGPKTKDLIQVYTGICRSANDKSIYDSSINDYLALFLKCSKDGQPRDIRKLNSVLVVDVSGSMGCPLTKRDKTSRLSLTKEAIKMFVSRLRDDDAFGLVEFTQQAQVLIPCDQKKNLDLNIIFGIVDSLVAGGGTSLPPGFNTGYKALQTFLSKNAKDSNCENRIVMITDVNDNFGPCGPILQAISESDIHTTIIGVSEDFQSKTCEALKQVKGFNYFCAVETKDLDKYLFQNFDWTFFPCLNNVQIRLEAQNIRKFNVFGTPDREKVYQNNNFAQKGINNYLITKIPTLFPSELQYVDDQVLTHGGLILVKITPKEQLKSFKGKLTVAYDDLSQKHHSQTIQLDFELPLNEQFYSNQSLEDAIRGYYFVSQIKEILKQIDNTPLADRSQGRLGKYLQALESLRTLAPESKVPEVDLMMQAVSAMNA